MRKLFIVAGESSGDLHGSALVRAILRREPDAQIKAVGGELMREAGAELVADLTGHAVIGLFEGFRNVARIYSTFRAVLRLLRADPPDAVVLIDYPEFNLRLARKVRKLGIPVIYYISPQVWAWRQWRVKVIEKYVDKMLVIFPFEEEFYRRHGVQVEFVGHPLTDELATVPDRSAARAALGLPENATVIGLLPGSRRKEVEAILPIIVQAARLIPEQIGRPVKFVAAKAPSVDGRVIQEIASSLGLDVEIVDDDTYRVMRSSDLLLVASGTATVEAMILGTPMIVVYRVSTFTWVLFIRLMKVAHYAMVNIVAGREIVPEFIQWNASPELIAREAATLFQGDRLSRMRNDLAQTTARLRRPPDPSDDPGNGGVPSVVAARILDFIAHKG